MDLGTILLGLGAVAMAVVALSALGKNGQLQRIVSSLQHDKQVLDATIASLHTANQNLARYQHIVDVQSEVQAQRQALANEVHAARAQLFAQQTATQSEIAAQVEAARQQAASIIADANVRAQETAADALQARRNLEANRREAQAMKNIVEGYGDQYLVPTQSLLDDLAEHFGFTEAGESLKKARATTRAMVKEGRAATCGYVEANRRETAVAFVVDAFNGKVDTILASAKADNFGTLRQKILDAFTLVNLNGRAFRDARILEEYLNARVEELRWAAAAHALREQEREEQRLIKEQIREEEKARREYERAIKEAAKEEDGIRKAMERVQKEVSKATEAQREQYEAQLRELSAKLQAAEDKNRRALSMAQQTKTGHVYVISNIGSFGEDVLKIGLTRRLEPTDRIRELGDASVPFEFDVHALILSDDAPALERALHRHFVASQVNKVNPRKEFFRVPLAVVQEELAKLGVQATWTMTAAAAEYRESLAIEKAIKNNPAGYQAWLNKQLVLDPVTFDDPGEDDGASLQAEAAAQ